MAVVRARFTQGVCLVCLILCLAQCSQKAPVVKAPEISPLVGPLSLLFTATVGVGLEARLSPAVPPFPGTNLPAYVLCRTNNTDLIHGICYAVPGGEDGLPSLLAQFCEVEPFRLLAADWVDLSIPGNSSLTVLRVKLSLASETNRKDRGHYRFYGLNPWQPAMPLLFDGLWLSNHVPDPQAPEADLAQTVQDWRTGVGGDLIGGGWTRSLETFSPDAEQNAFDTNGQYRHFAPELGLTEGLWARCGESIGLLPLRGATNFNAPRKAINPSPVRLRLVFDGNGRACWARYSGDAPGPDGCWVRVP